MDLRRVWEERARQWREWARTPGHDAFWAYSESFLDDIVPPKSDALLDIGCGEGRVARALAERASHVVGVDSSPTLVLDAKEADTASTYLVADATALPFRNRSFDTVIAYNSLMDLNDMSQGVAEAARVLKDGGRLCICVLHPIRDAGSFATDDAESTFVISDYFETRRYDVRFERNGLEMTFSSWRYPLSAYAEAVERAGLVIDRIKEPLPASTAVSARPEWKKAERIPMFLFLRAIRQ
jgi:SAM-dependent methyltransferase